MLKILSWAKSKNIHLIIDESFLDFSDEETPSLITQDILNEYVNIYIIKSISKSY
jgi:histidinol-phosphate/aromatic aminotransferase/cobyric acid decarboxylase-like protein